jgi:integrase
MIRLEEGIYLRTYQHGATGRERVIPTIYIQYGNGNGGRVRESTRLSVVYAGQPTPTPDEVRNAEFTPHKTNLRTARQRRAEKIKAAADGELPERSWRKLTYDDLAADLAHEFTAQKRWAQHTRFKYARSRLDVWFMGMRVARITGNRILAYRNARIEDGAANATINRELGFVRQMLRLGRERGKVVRVPAVAFLDEPAALAGFVEPDGLALIVAELEEHHKRWPQVLFITGWRKRSVLTLPRSARRDGWLWLPGAVTKNKRPVQFPDEGALKAVLDEQQEYVRRIERATGAVIPHLFCYQDGRAITRPEDAWKAACKRAGHEGLTIHSLKRSAVRQAEANGVSRGEFMDLAGIKTETIYERYNICDSGRLKAAAAKLPGLPGAAERKVVSLRP